MPKFNPEITPESPTDGAEPTVSEFTKPVLMDRVIVTMQGKAVPLWLALTDDKRILMVAGDGKGVASLELIDLIQVKGTGSHLKFYTISGPTHVQFLPVLRDPNIGPKNMYGAGAVGNLYLEGKYEKLSNVVLWINTLKEYNIQVRYHKTSVVITLGIIGGIVGIFALAGLWIVFTFLTGIIPAFFH